MIIIDNRIAGYWDALATQREKTEASLTWWKKIAFLILDQERDLIHMPLNKTLGLLLDTRLKTIKLGLKNLEGNFDEDEFKLITKYWPTALVMSWISESPEMETFGEDLPTILKPLYQKFEIFVQDALRVKDDSLGDGVNDEVNDDNLGNGLQLYDQLIDEARGFIKNIAGK